MRSSELRRREYYRSSSLEDIQGYKDLQMIWSAIRESERGKREPLRDDVCRKIIKGLEATVKSKWSNRRTKSVAAAIILAIADKDWSRDVWRSPRNTRGR